MSTTLRPKVRALLDATEPDYATIRESVVPDDISALSELAKSSDTLLASRAMYTLTLIPVPAAVQTLIDIAPQAHAIARVGAAHGLPHFAGLDVSALALMLLDDHDVGVRKEAIKASRSLQLDVLTPKLREIAASDSEAGLRRLAKEVLDG